MDPIIVTSLLINFLLAVGTFAGPWLAKRHAEHKEIRESARESIKLQYVVDTVSELRTAVSKMPELLVRMGTLEEVVKHHVHSDHRELRGEIAVIRDSRHDGE